METVQKAQGQKPLILPFRTPLGYYFYETNRNEIVSVNQALYAYIDAVMKGDERAMEQAPEKAAQQYSELVACGYFSTKRVETVKHPATDMLGLYLTRKIDSMTLQVTQKCNLRCSYCVYSEKGFKSQRQHADKQMSWETAKAAVDFFYERSIDTSLPNISFYGGEPLLNFDLVRRIVAYAEQLFEGRQLGFSTTTNATLLTDEIIDYLAEHRVKLLISLDGPKSIHDKNRTFAANSSGSYDVVMRNIRRIWERHPQYAKETVSTNMVINPQDSFDELNSVYDDPCISRMRSLHSIVDVDEGEPLEYADAYINDSAYSRFKGLLSAAGQVAQRDVKRLTADEMVHLQESMRKIKYAQLGTVAAPGGPCIPGKMRLFVNYKGDFFPCERVSETSQCMRIGSLDTGFDMAKVGAVLNIGLLTESECKDCWAFIHCNICAKRVDKQGVLSEEKKRRFCQESKRAAFSTISGKVLLFELHRHLARTKKEAYA